MNREEEGPQAMNVGDGSKKEATVLLQSEIPGMYEETVQHPPLDSKTRELPARLEEDRQTFRLLTRTQGR